MKNIHVLPTDKPSRLYLTTKEYIFEEVNSVSTDECQNKHIYITSDEEIKEGDWFITTDNNEIHKSDWIKFHFNNGKKIILTTDQDIIKDGVQAIDDEFLEWFVKNPSCEWVEIQKGFEDGTSYGYNFLDYKIIIPKEEPKQETLEEVAERLYSGVYRQFERMLFIKGAKWQQEQILDFLYSEITERRDYSASKMCEKVIEFIEKFKKK